MKTRITAIQIPRNAGVVKNKFNIFKQDNTRANSLHNCWRWRERNRGLDGHQLFSCLREAHAHAIWRACSTRSIRGDPQSPCYSLLCRILVFGKHNLANWGAPSWIYRTAQTIASFCRTIKPGKINKDFLKASASSIYTKQCYCSYEGRGVMQRKTIPWNENWKFIRISIHFKENPDENYHGQRSI